MLLNPRILHIYGPLWINSFGLMIALGLVIFVFLSYRHPLRIATIDSAQYLNALFVGILGAILGGRLMFVALEYEQFQGHWIDALLPWEAGFALLGAVIATPFAVAFYAYMIKVDWRDILDVVTLYAPLLQSISRLGCFFAGCCYGCEAPANLPWAITYTHPDSLAPLGIPLHPAQIYSALASLTIFIILFALQRHLLRAKGRCIALFFGLEGIARALANSWRGSIDSADLWLLWGWQITPYTLLAFCVAAFGFLWYSATLIWPSERTARQYL